MKDWLKKQGEIEKDLIRTCGGQTEVVIDDLLPQIRLAAIENGGVATLQMTIDFQFSEDGAETKVITQGAVTFPAKRSAVESVCP